MSEHHPRFTAADLSVAALMDVLWGLNIIAMKVTVGATGAFSSGAVRMVALTLVLSPWLKAVPGRTRALIWLGLLNGGMFLLFMNLALKISDNVGALAIAGQMSIPISVVMGITILGERVTPLRVGGIVLAFMGVAMLVFDPRIVHELPGLILMVCAATCWAGSTLLQRRLAGTPVLTMYAWTGLMGMVLFLPLSLVIEPGVLAATPRLGWQPIAWFLFSVLGSTLMGQGGLAWLLRRHPVSSVIPLTVGATVVSVGASHVFFGTPLTPIMILGGLVALIGVLVVTRSSPAPIIPIEV